MIEVGKAEDGMRASGARTTTALVAGATICGLQYNGIAASPLAYSAMICAGIGLSLILAIVSFAADGQEQAKQQLRTAGGAGAFAVAGIFVLGSAVLPATTSALVAAAEAALAYGLGIALAGFAMAQALDSRG